MSLEALIAANTEALVRLTAVLQSQQITPAADSLVADVKATRSRKSKDTPPAETGAQAGSPAASTTDTAFVNDGKKVSIKLRTGDPEGTRYFHIAAHNTVAAIKPGEPIPSIAGIAEIDGSEYDALNAKYSSALVQPEGNGASAAGATSAAQTASVAGQASSQPTIDGPAVMEIFKKLHARDGNDGLRIALEELSKQLGSKVARVGDLVADASKHAAAYAYADALLNPKAADPAANLF